MKITDQTIIDAARRQRDKAGEQLMVRPWMPNRRRFRVPLWLTAVPAAAIAGFLFGTAVVQRSTFDDQRSMAQADTIYITREVPVPQTPDTVIRYITRQHPVATPTPPPASTGHTMHDDGIDYAMLVRN